MILVLEVVEGKLEEVVGHMKEVSGCSMKKVMGRMKKKVGCMKELLDHMKSSIEAQVLDSSGFSDILPQVCGPHRSRWELQACCMRVEENTCFPMILLVSLRTHVAVCHMLRDQVVLFLLI